MGKQLLAISPAVIRQWAVKRERVKVQVCKREEECEEIYHRKLGRKGCAFVFHLAEILIIVAILQSLINHSS